MKIDTELLHNIGIYVSEHLKELPATYTYHNLSHTLNVVKNADFIASEIKLDKSDKEILLIAAWFHDTGYMEGAEKHEKRGIAIASKYLKENGVDEEKIKAVADCIRATEYPQQPFNLTAKILCDADMLHIADRTYPEKLELLRNEAILAGNKVPADDEWLKSNITFLVNYTFFTPYCRENFEKPKLKNIALLQGKLETFTNGVSSSTQINAENDLKSDRSIDSMLRIVSQNQTELSSMADNKANILITINTLVLSIIFSVLLTKLDNHPHFIIPTIILICVCITTIIITILSTRPKVSNGKFTEAQLKNRETNLLFFGNFYNMPLHDYQAAMTDMMKDKNYLYDVMTRDIHILGKVLAKKYHFLSQAYNIFMFGLIVAVVAFSIAAFVANHIPK